MKTGRGVVSQILLAWIFAGAAAAHGAEPAAVPAAIQETAGSGQAFAAPLRIAPEMEKDLRTLIELAGVLQNARAGMEQGLALERRLHPELPEMFYEEFRKEASQEAFIKLFLPIYATTFSHQEVKELISLYESPIGRRLVEVTPVLTAKGVLAGRAWGAATGQRVLKDLVAKGVIKCGEAGVQCPEEKQHQRQN